MSFHVPEKYRLRNGLYGTDERYGNNGAFFVPYNHPLTKGTLKVIASDGDGWEHVSVSLSNRCPNWEMMCIIKNMFWDEEDAVMQLHPPKSQYINNHPFCLHLWKPVNQVIPLPPSILVGI